jgi:hypothetical protein
MMQWNRSIVPTQAEDDILRSLYDQAIRLALVDCDMRNFRGLQWLRAHMYVELTQRWEFVEMRQYTLQGPEMYK